MILRRILGLSRTFRRNVAVAVAVSLLGAGLLALLAPLTGRIVGEALDRDRTGVLVGGALAGTLVLSHLFAVWASERLFADVSAGLGSAMREGLATHVGAAPLEDVEGRGPGDLIARGGHEIDEVAAFATAQLPALVVSGGYLVMSLVVLLGHSVALTGVLVLVYLPAAAGILLVFRRRSRDAFEREAARAGALAGVIAEGATVDGALREPAAASWWAGRVEHENRRLRSAIEATVNALNLFSLLLVVEAAAIAAILGAGAVLVSGGGVRIPTVAVFVVASGTLFAIFAQLGDALASLAAARAYAARHFEALDAFGSRAEGAATAMDAGVRVRGVRFGYAGRPAVFDGATVSFPPGSRTVVVGPSGAGKTTLAKLIAGLYDPQAGTVEIGGVPARDARTAAGRRAAVLVGQESYVIPGSLRGNLLLPAGTADEHVVTAAARLGLGSWLDRFGGLDREIGRDLLDAGDRQILAILRATLRDADVLIFDESTASLGDLLADELHDRLDRIAGNRTLIVIAHHEATIDRYRRVVSVEPDGDIVVTEEGDA